MLWRKVSALRSNDSFDDGFKFSTWYSTWFYRVSTSWYYQGAPGFKAFWLQRCWIWMFWWHIWIFDDSFRHSGHQKCHQYLKLVTYIKKSLTFTVGVKLKPTFENGFERFFNLAEYFFNWHFWNMITLYGASKVMVRNFWTAFKSVDQRCQNS